VSYIYEPEYQVLIDCLKTYRLQSKMTQQELANSLGCSQTYVSKYEQSQKRLDIIEVRKICNCLGVDLIELITEFEERLRMGGNANG